MDSPVYVFIKTSLSFVTNFDIISSKSLFYTLFIFKTHFLSSVSVFFIGKSFLALALLEIIVLLASLHLISTYALSSLPHPIFPSSFKCKIYS